ncbi:MAG: hypothetical protein QOH77_1214, partial [Actinomycetota bacterium]|nr:hypothetical protein [Actinomycetota bacterium]
RAAIATYGSPQLGLTGLISHGQTAGRRSAFTPKSSVPSNLFHGSMIRSSVLMSSPKFLDHGAADSCAR